MKAKPTKFVARYWHKSSLACKAILGLRHKYQLQKVIFALFIFLWAASLLAAQENTASLYEQGLQAFEEQNYERAKELLLQSIQQDNASERTAEQFYTLGQVFEKLEDEAMALKSYGRSIGLAPQNWNAYYAYAQIAISQENPRLAWQAYSRIIELDPKNVKAYRLRAELLQPYVAFLALLDYDKAIELSKEPKDLTQLYLQRGAANIAQRRYADAEADFLQALKQKKLDKTQRGAAYIGLGHSQLRQQKLSSARKNLHRAIPRERKNPYVYIYLGAVETARGKKRNARTYFERAFSIDPEISELYWRRAQFAQQENRIQEAEADYNRAIELAPKDSEAYLERGRFYEAARQYEKALADYNLSIEYLNPNLFRKREGETLDEAPLLRAFLYRGAVQTELGLYEEALESYQILLERNVENADVYIGIGKVQVATGQYEEALASYEKALELSPVKGPGSARPLYLLGSTKAQLGRLEEGLKDVVMARKREPRSAGVHYFQGLLYVQKKDYRKAETSLKKAIRYERENPKYTYALALFYYQRTDFDQARKELDALIESYPGYSRAYALRARTYFLQGNIEAAFQDTALALKREPQNAGLYILQSALHQSQQQNDLALQDYQLAIEIMPESAALYGARAQLHQKMGQDREALADLNKAISLNPEKKEMAQILADKGLLLFQNIQKEPQTEENPKIQEAIGYFEQAIFSYTGAR